MKEAGRWMIVLSLLSLSLLNDPVVWAEGNVWTAAGLEGLYIWVLAVDPHNPGTIYAGTTDSNGDEAHIFKTTDGGIHWTNASNGLPAANYITTLHYISALVVDPNDSSTVYAGVFSIYLTPRLSGAPSVFKTTDGGANWVRADFGLPMDSIGGLALAADPGNLNTLYAASGDSSQVYKTTDGGATWNATVSSQLQSGDPYGLGAVHAALAVDPHNSGTVYLGLYGVGVFKSTDAGTTWSESSGPKVVSDHPYRPMDDALAGVFAIAIDPQSPNIIYAGAGDLCGCMDAPLSTGAWKSVDGGATWTAVNTGLPPPFNSVEMQPIWSLAVHPDSSGTVYASTGGSVFKTTNGGETWIALRDSFNSTRTGGFPSLVVTSVLPGVLYAGGTGVSEITDQIPVLSLQSEYCATSPWTLSVSNGSPNTTIRLTGTGNGQPWEIRDWATTDANGTFREDGRFTGQVRGSWTEIVDVGGAHSNAISFVVSDCAAKD